jgi:hypothetical protein
MPYAWNWHSESIFYSNLASCICALRPTYCIVSQIFSALYALRPAPNFYEIHPWPYVCLSLINKSVGKFLNKFLGH